MKKNITTILLVCVVALGFTLSGCGSAGSDGSPNSPTGTSVTGVVSLGTATNITVSLKDSSVPAKEMTTTPKSHETYALNVNGLTPPFMLKAAGTDTSGNSRLYSISTKGGTANINPLSNTLVAAAADGISPDELYEKPDPVTYRKTADKLPAVIDSLRTVLAPLFALYQTSGDPITDKDVNSGLRAMLHDVRIAVKSGSVTVTNKLTGGVIYSAPLNDLASGTFYTENMPAGPGTTSGATLYADNCSTCHGPLATSSKLGATADTIESAITNNVGGMGKFSNFSATQIQAIADALAGTTPPPAACTYTYSSWNACQSDNTRTRSMLSSSPAGCIGTPVLSQPCIFVPPVTTCSSFSYSAWGTCQSNNTQTRTVTSSSPAGCTGGTPVLSQACTYVPPVTTCSSFTYSAWGTCQSNNTQTRTVTSSSPAGCTGGTPVLSQACTYVPPTPACGSCHSIPPSTGQHTYHVSSLGFSCSTCHGTGYSKTTVNTATHANGTIDVVSSLNYNSTASSCSPGCHGKRTW